MDITTATFRTHYVPLLKEQGVENDKDGDGYYIPEKPEGT